MVAVVLQALIAIGTVLTAVDDAANTHQVPGLELGYVSSYRRHSPHDFMARYTGIERTRPFRPHLVKVGVTDTAEGNVDLYVMRTRTASRDLEGFERSVACMGGISVDVHGVYSEKISAHFLENWIRRFF